MTNTPLERWKRIRAFVHFFLTHHLIKPFSEMHNDWFRMLSNKYAALAAPRGFAKSHIFSFFYPLYLLLEEGPKDVVLISSNERLASKWMRKILTELESNAKIVEYYGLQKTASKWTYTEAELANGSTLMAIGYTGKIRGIRPDAIIVDDIEDKEEVYNPDVRVKIKERLDEDITFTLKPTGQMILVGTIVHPLSVLQGFLTDPHLSDPTLLNPWTQKRYQALVTDDKGQEHSAWEVQWSLRQLQEERYLNPLAFQQERMNDPVPAEAKPFKLEWLKYWDTLPPLMSVSTTIDPAISAAKDADYTAIITAGVDCDGYMYVLEYDRGRYSPEKTIDRILEHAKKWNPHTIGIEDVGFQKMLRFSLEATMRERKQWLNIKPLKLDVSPDGRKKRFRIEALIPLFASGKVFFPKDSPALVGEYEAYPIGQHDDLMDALAAQLEVMQRGKKENITPDLSPDSWDYYWAQKTKNRNKVIGQKRWH